jgi:hypothetical protein
MAISKYPSQLMDRFDRLDGTFRYLWPPEKIPKEFFDTITKVSNALQDAFSEKGWWDSDRWSKADMAHWNAAVDKVAEIVEQSLKIPDVKIVTPQQYEALWKQRQKKNGKPKVVELPEEVITGRYPILLGLGAAMVLLMVLQKKGPRPLPSRQGLSGNRDQHAADSWFHLGRFSERQSDYLKALAIGDCEGADRLRTELYSELAVARAFREWSPRKRQHDIMDGIRTRQKQMEDSESHYKYACTRIAPLQMKLL